MQWRNVLLPAPDCADDRDDLALVDREVDAAEHLERAPHVEERFLHVVGDDDERLTARSARRDVTQGSPRR